MIHEHAFRPLPLEQDTEHCAICGSPADEHTEVEGSPQRYRLYRVNAVHYVQARSPEEAADTATHQIELALQDTGTLDLIVETIGLPDILSAPFAFFERCDYLDGECNEWDQEDFDAVRLRALKHRLKRRRHRKTNGGK